jgi:Ion transport protein
LTVAKVTIASDRTLCKPMSLLPPRVMTERDHLRGAGFELQRSPTTTTNKATRLNKTGGLQMIVPTNADELHLAHNAHGEKSWQAKALNFLHRRSVQYVMMGLLLMDVLVLFLDLFLLAEYPSCSIIERDAISCCPASAEEQGNRMMMRILSEAGASSGEEEELCLAPSDVGLYPAGCNPERWPYAHTAEEVFFGITITILSIFLLENLVQIVVLTPQVYFRQVFYVLDFFIITVSIALEVTFQVHDDEALQNLVGLLVLGRVWRFVRISHGLIEVTSEISSQKYHDLLEHVEELEALLRKEGIPVPVNEKVQRSREEFMSYHSSPSTHGATSASPADAKSSLSAS